MTLNEIKDFLIRISKEEKANSKISDAISCIIMKQALFVNIFLMFILTTVHFSLDMSVWGGIVGLSIPCAMLIFRMKQLKNEYMKDAKKIVKKEKINLYSGFFIKVFEVLLEDIELKFVTNNLVKKETSKDMRGSISKYLVNKKEELTYNELQNYLIVMESQSGTSEYRELSIYFKENKQRLLGNNFKEF